MFGGNKVGLILMANDMYAKVNRVVRQIVERPQDRLPLSREALQLLREIPLKGNGATLAEGAENIRWGVRQLYPDPKQRADALQLAEEIGRFISAVKPAPESIH